MSSIGDVEDQAARWHPTESLSSDPHLLLSGSLTLTCFSMPRLLACVRQEVDPPSSVTSLSLSSPSSRHLRSANC